MSSGTAPLSIASLRPTTSANVCAAHASFVASVWFGYHAYSRGVHAVYVTAGPQNGMSFTNSAGSRHTPLSTPWMKHAAAGEKEGVATRRTTTGASRRVDGRGSGAAARGRRSRVPGMAPGGAAAAWGGRGGAKPPCAGGHRRVIPNPTFS
jgi:hypothetical protein